MTNGLILRFNDTGRNSFCKHLDTLYAVLITTLSHAKITVFATQVGNVANRGNTLNAVQQDFDIVCIKQFERPPPRELTLKGRFIFVIYSNVRSTALHFTVSQLVICNYCNRKYVYQK